MPLLAVNVRTTTLAIQQVVGTQSEDGPSPHEIVAFLARKTFESIPLQR